MQSEDPKSLIISQIDEYAGQENTGQDENLFSLRKILYVIFRHKWKVILVFLGTVIITPVFIYFAVKDAYESRAQLMVKPGRESLSMDAYALEQGMSGRSQGLINSEIAILKSNYLAEQVVDRIGLEAFLPPGTYEEFLNVVKTTNETEETSNTNRVWKLSSSNSPILYGKVLRMFNKQLNVTVNSNIIDLSFLAHSPQLAREVLETLINLYMERHINVHKGQVTTKFFEEQKKRLLAEIQKREEKLKEFCDQRGIVSMEGQKEALFTQINSLRSDIIDSDNKISSSYARIALLEKKLRKLRDSSATTEGDEDTEVTSPTIEEIKIRLIDLRSQKAHLETKYVDPTIRSEWNWLGNKIRHTEAELLMEKESIIKHDLEMERMQLQEQLEHIRFLRETVEKRKADLVALTNSEMILTGLQRDVNVASDEYRRYIDNFQKARVSEALDENRVSNIAVVQPPTLPDEPVKSKKKRYAALGILMGLFGAIGLAYGKEFLDDTLKTDEDVKKRLSLPVLVTIPYKKI